MKLGRKVGNTRSIQGEDFFLEIAKFLEKNSETEDEIQVEDLFFRDHYDLERKKLKTKSKPFFLKNINFWKFLPRDPKFEYPPLNSVNLANLAPHADHVDHANHADHIDLYNLKEPILVEEPAICTLSNQLSYAIKNKTASI